MRSLLGVLNIFASLLTWFALYFLLPIVTALLYGEIAPMRGFVIGAAVSVLGGVSLRMITRRYRYDLKPRDAYLLVTVSWLTIAAVASIPLLIDMPGLSFTRAYFESMSGLSTTGATQLSGIDGLAAAMLIAAVVVTPIGGWQALPAFTAPTALLAGIGVGVSSSVIPYVTDQLAMARLPRASYATMVALLPAIATIIGIVVLTQIPTPIEIAGLTLIIAGVALHRPQTNDTTQKPSTTPETA